LIVLIKLWSCIVGDNTKRRQAVGMGSRQIKFRFFAMPTREKMKIIICICAFFSFNYCLSQEIEIGKYKAFNSKNEASENFGYIKLLSNKRQIWYQFFYPSVTVLKDTVVNGEKGKIEKTSYTPTQQGISGKYMFYKKKRYVMFQYTDITDSKTYKHSQFSLSIKDTTDYVNMVFQPNPVSFGYLLIEGKACYKTDSVIIDNLGSTHGVHVINVLISHSSDRKVCIIRVFVDKTTYIPLRYEYFDCHNKLIYYLTLDYSKDFNL